MRALLTFAVLAGSAVAGGCGSNPGPVAVAKPAPGENDGPVLIPATGQPAERVENPQYKSWAAFPAGTTVVHKAVTETVGIPEKTVTTTTYTLVAVAADFLTMKSQIHYKRYDGFEANEPPEEYRVNRLVDLPPGVDPADFGKPVKGAEQGEEKLTMGGKEYQTRWYKGKATNEGGQVTGQTWVSDQAPGGLVKSVSNTSGVNKRTTIELVAVKTP